MGGDPRTKTKTTEDRDQAKLTHKYEDGRQDHYTSKGKGKGKGKVKVGCKSKG